MFWNHPNTVPAPFDTDIYASPEKDAQTTIARIGSPFEVVRKKTEGAFPETARPSRHEGRLNDGREASQAKPTERPRRGIQMTRCSRPCGRQ
jgi:hypothetical protein